MDAPLIAISRHFQSDAPVSGLYMDDLPYVNIKDTGASVRDDQSVFDLITRLINAAQQKVLGDVRLKMYGNSYSPSTLKHDTAGIFDKNQIIVPTVAGFSGIRFRITSGDFMRLRVQKLTLLWTSNQTTTIKVYDLITGQLLDTVDITTVANQKTTVDVNLLYPSSFQLLHLFFEIDSSLATAFKTDDTFTDSCDTCNGGGHNGHNELGVIEIDGVKIAGSVKSDHTVVSTGSTHGMAIQYVLECDIDSWLESVLELLAPAIRYLASADILKYTLASKKLNDALILYPKQTDAFIQEALMSHSLEMETILQTLTPPNTPCFPRWQGFSSGTALS